MTLTSSIHDHRSFCFVAWPDGDAAIADAVPSGSAPTCLGLGSLMVPAGVSYLVARPGEAPRIETTAPASLDHVWVLEPVVDGHNVHLLLVSHSGRRLHVNALPAPPVAVLAEKDQVALDGNRLLHVSTYVRPYIGPMPNGPHKQGKPPVCSLCQIPIEPGTNVYVCPFCGDPAHLEAPAESEQAESEPAAQRGSAIGETESGGLECAATISTCPTCLSPVVHHEGLTYIPEEPT